MPEVSIVIPVLNGAAYIERCIRSVLNQNVDVQLIVMDGGSTDGTQGVVEAFGSQISHFYSGPDGGQAEAINRGLRLATGTWFNWLNADDEFTPNALQKVVAQSNTGAQVVTGFCRHVDANGNELAIGGTVTQGSIELTMANYSMGQPAHFYRTDVLKGPSHQLDERLHYCMDMDLWFRFLLEHGCEQVKHIPSILANFTVHPNSKTVASAAAMRDEKYALFQSLAESCSVAHLLPELAERASAFRKDYEIIGGFEFSTDVFIGHLAWHILLDTFERGDIARSRELYRLCCKGGRITYGDAVGWNFRFLKETMTLQNTCRFP